MSRVCRHLAGRAGGSLSIGTSLLQVQLCLQRHEVQVHVVEATKATLDQLQNCGERAEVRPNEVRPA